jgi:hypothetical protein
MLFFSLAHARRAIEQRQTPPQTGTKESYLQKILLIQHGYPGAIPCAGVFGDSADMAGQYFQYPIQISFSYSK